MPARNGYRDAAREKKAQRLATALETVITDGRSAAEVADRFDVNDRNMLAQYAGVNVPSDESWQRTIEVLRERERMRRVAS